MKATLPSLAFAVLLASCSASSSDSSSPPFDQGPGYVLKLGDDFNAGQNFIDDFGISVALVVDVSGSMYESPAGGGDPKFIQAARALGTVADYLQTLTTAQPELKIQVALFKFSNSAETLLPMTSMDGAGLSALRALARPESLQPEGGTAIGKALETGAGALAQSGTIFNSLIIVTDGENNGDPDPFAVIDAIYSNRNSANTADLKITTSSQLLSFIGFDIDSPQFRAFHEKGARVMSADNQAELESSLKTLLEADITKLEGN